MKCDWAAEDFTEILFIKGKNQGKASFFFLEIRFFFVKAIVQDLHCT